MATSRSLSTALSPTLSAAPSTAHSPGAPRHRLRAVDRDEAADVTMDEAVSEAVDVAGLLPPGATWLPAPPHALPTLPGRPPMIGYLVLVPADQEPPFLTALAQKPQLPTASGQYSPLPTAPDRQPPSASTAGRPEAVGPAGDEEGGTPLIRVDAGRRTVEVDGRELGLTYPEFELLAHLVARPGRVHSRDQRVSTVWGYGHVGDGRTVDVHVARRAASWAPSTGRRSGRCAASATRTCHRRRAESLLTAERRSVP